MTFSAEAFREFRVLAIQDGLWAPKIDKSGEWVPRRISPLEAEYRRQRGKFVGDEWQCAKVARALNSGGE